MYICVLSWNIEDIEYIVILIYTLYWIYIYKISLLYVCTWICQVYANALDVFLSNLYKNRCCCTPAVSVTQTPHDDKKENEMFAV